MIGLYFKKYVKNYFSFIGEGEGTTCHEKQVRHFLHSWRTEPKKVHHHWTRLFIGELSCIRFPEMNGNCAVPENWSCVPSIHLNMTWCREKNGLDDDLHILEYTKFSWVCFIFPLFFTELLIKMEYGYILLTTPGVAPRGEALHAAVSLLQNRAPCLQLSSYALTSSPRPLPFSDWNINMSLTA